MIRISVDTSGTIAMLARAEKQVRYAAAVALTRSAKRVESRVKSDLAKLDASPYTLRSTFSTSATKSKLEAMVGIKDKKPGRGTAPAILLKEHFGGGSRGNKPMEKALAAMGVLPNGWRVVAGAGMPLDAYHNPKRAAITELLGSLKSRASVFKGRGKNIKLIGYFVVLPSARSHLQPGIYKRVGRDAIKPMLIFIKAATYRSRFDLSRTAQSVVSQHFNAEFNAAYAAALATAR
jgi:hypothetical protein